LLDEASTKIRSAHVDRLYVRRPHPFRRARWITTFVCFAVALVWSIVYGLPAKSRVHDPGPLSTAHRQWQNDCRRCHDGGDSSGAMKNVSLAVSDNACLQCHDGAIHQMNQAHFISADKMRSANCVSCHVEHKGGEALAANQDQTCVQCHGNLGSEMNGAKTEVTNRVVAFDVGEKHPKFGRPLEREGKLVDPTVLKFNHKKHMVLDAIQSNCVVCHEPRDPSPAAKPPFDKAQDKQAARCAPPWKTAKDRSMDAIASSDGRYTQPINYERHCQSCHELKLPISETRIAHADMSLVRGQIASFTPADLRGIAEAKPAEKPRPGQRAAKPKSLNEQAIEKVRASLDAEKLQKLNEAIANAPGATTQPTKPDANLVELYVAYSAGTSCVYCHEMQGDVPALAKSSDALLASVPTQIPDSPRRWFTASQFDHRAHRGMSCVSCHAAAVTSTETSQLLQPNIDACVACHRTDEHNQQLADTAPSNCITCHQFHDRRLESWGNGKNAMSAPADGHRVQ
jgi:predicted CXXCH cytochrome family protein